MGRRNGSDAGDDDVRDPPVALPVLRYVPGDGHVAGLEDDKRDPPADSDQAVEEQKAQTPIDSRVGLRGGSIGVTDERERGRVVRLLLAVRVSHGHRGGGEAFTPSC